MGLILASMVKILGVNLDASLPMEAQIMSAAKMAFGYLWLLKQLAAQSLAAQATTFPSMICL